MKKSAIVVSLLLALLIVALFVYLRDTSAPRISLSPGGGPVSDQRTLTLDIEDPGAGLKNVRVDAIQGGKSIELLSRSFDPGTASARETFTLTGAGLTDGPLEIRVTAVDRSIYPLGRGNTAVTSAAYALDNRAPVISLVTSTHNISQGGAALILFRLDEEPSRAGVSVGDYFFPAYRLDGDLYASLFAFPWAMKSSDFSPRLVAADTAGNERRTAFSYHANAKAFPKDKIQISDGFLQNKAPEFELMVPGVRDPLELFLKVNRKVRDENVRQLEEIGRQTAPRPLWSGAFVRQAGASRGFFAQERTYYYTGKEIDRATHLGIDIAGLAQMPVVAANRGTVAFADYLGIYGYCIVIDHGLGLQSLYAHLSEMGVKPGETVEKGQQIGRTGATGMAGGDHLHFGMLVAGLEVSPLEWWDPSWVRNNIDSKLELVPGKSRP